MTTNEIKKAARVTAWRAGGEIVHVGFFVTFDNDGTTPLYRLRCQGRDARYLSRAADDQNIVVTCQKCKGKQR